MMWKKSHFVQLMLVFNEITMNYVKKITFLALICVGEAIGSRIGYFNEDTTQNPGKAFHMEKRPKS